MSNRTTPSAKSKQTRSCLLKTSNPKYLQNPKSSCIYILPGIKLVFPTKKRPGETVVFFKPRNKDDIDFPLKKIKSIDKYSLGFLIRIYNQIDKYINELYSDKYLFYLTDKSKILVNDFNLMIGLFMENGFKVLSEVTQFAVHCIACI